MAEMEWAWERAVRDEVDGSKAPDHIGRVV